MDNELEKAFDVFINLYNNKKLDIVFTLKSKHTQTDSKLVFDSTSPTEIKKFFSKWTFDKETNLLTDETGIYSVCDMRGVPRVYDETEYKEIENPLITTENTKVLANQRFLFNAHHNYRVVDNAGDLLCEVHFQEGPVKENDLNGIFHEDLIAIVLDRLYSFQKSDFACQENEMTIIKLEEALMWLRKRNLRRVKKNIMGTSKRDETEGK